MVTVHLKHFEFFFKKSEMIDVYSLTHRKEMSQYDSQLLEMWMILTVRYLHASKRALWKMFIQAYIYTRA